MEKKNKRAAGNKGTKYHIFSCKKTILDKFNVPVHKITFKRIIPIEISYEIICALARREPRNAYFELLDHPERTIP